MKSLATLAVAALLLPACQSFAAFTYYSTVQGWRTAVGGPTIQRNPTDYYSGVGQPVDPEVWADVGVHLVSSGPLLTSTYPGGPGPQSVSIYSGIGQSFEVKWDQPITALWYRVECPSGGPACYSGNDFIGGVADGQWGVTSTVAFDRIVISFPNASYYGFLRNLEWGVVPSPGALVALALGALCPGRRRRRA